MRRTLIATAATLALLSGAAVAQTTSPTVSNPSSSTSSMSNSATGGQLASAEELIGKTVYGRDNEKIGEVDDVILDANGQAKQLVVSSGGFLGIGEKQVAVDYTAANWDSQNDRLNLAGMSREDVKAMPEFEYDDTMTSLNKNRKPAETGTTAPGAAPTGGSMGTTGTGSTGGSTAQ